MARQLVQYAIAHSGSLTFALGFAVTAISSTWPEQRPKTLDDFWAWGRDFIHQVSNQRRPTITKPQ